MSPNTIVTWPSSTYTSFEDAVISAASNGVGIIEVLSGVCLDKTIVLKDKIQRVIIRGVSIDGSKPLIESSGHCIFQVCGKGSCLTLENLQLHHTAYSSEKSEVGGAVFLLGDSNGTIERCHITSNYGFGIWIVQRASCTLVDTTICSTSRSGCVAFGKSSLTLNMCTVRDCCQHGLCLRGRCSLFMTDTKVTGSGVRAIYGYDSARIVLDRCSVGYTKSACHAAVEVRCSHATQEGANCTSNLRGGRKERDMGRVSSLIAQSVCFENNVGLDIQYSTPDIRIVSCYTYCSIRRQYILLHFESSPHRSAYISDLYPRRMEFILDENSDSISNGKVEEGKTEKVQWDYHRDDDQWVPYESSISEVLCTQYDLWLSRRSLLAVARNDLVDSSTSSFCLPPPFQRYSIDFDRMQQTNTDTFFVRSIRRVSKPV